MASRILYFRGNRVLDSTRWTGDVESAKAVARRDFETQRTRRGATGAAVVDDEGHVVLALSTEEFS